MNNKTTQKCVGKKKLILSNFVKHVIICRQSKDTDILQ